jgi:hypothetical protein
MRSHNDIPKSYTPKIRRLAVILISYILPSNALKGAALKRPPTLKQLPDFLRLQTGSDCQFKHAGNVLALEGDQDIIKVPEIFPVNSKAMAMTLDRYTITPTATIRHREA